MNVESRLLSAVKDALVIELHDARDRLQHCVDQLDDDQLWWRPKDEMNSIANLILHLCGNVKQWIIAGVGQLEDDDRQRAMEFSQRQRISRQEILEGLDLVISQADTVLRSLSGEDLIQGRRIQGYDVSGIEGLVGSIAHFRGHTQEIIHYTRAQLGEDYKFAFVPATKEQGM